MNIPPEECCRTAKKITSSIIVIYTMMGKLVSQLTNSTSMLFTVFRPMHFFPRNYCYASKDTVYIHYPIHRYTKGDFDSLYWFKQLLNVQTVALHFIVFVFVHHWRCFKKDLYMLNIFYYIHFYSYHLEYTSNIFRSTISDDTVRMIYINTDLKITSLCVVVYLAYF